MKAQGEGVRVIVIDINLLMILLKRRNGVVCRSYLGLRYLLGWSGKLWALEQGLQEVRTPYTLLLDAGIVLTPGIIVELRRKAQDENLALVLLMVESPMKNFIESLLMPAFVFFFKLLYPFGLANKLGSRVAAAAGGCILVETQALRSVGAFANLQHALIDDCTLAAHIKRAGLRTLDRTESCGM